MPDGAETQMLVLRPHSSLPSPPRTPRCFLRAEEKGSSEKMRLDPLMVQGRAQKGQGHVGGERVRAGGSEQGLG